MFNKMAEQSPCLKIAYNKKIQFFKLEYLFEAIQAKKELWFVGEREIYSSKDA